MIRLSKSVLNKDEFFAVERVLKKEFLGMGEEVKKFEDGLSKFLGRRTICVNSGTSALHLALQSIGLKKGDEVLVQSLTFVATFQAISATGAKPIPCEIAENTFTIDLDDAEKKITKHFPFKVGAKALLLYGKHRGSVGTIMDITGNVVSFKTDKNDTFTAPKNCVFIIGTDKAAITVV